MRTICRSGMKGLVRIRLVDKDGKLIKQFENHNFICDRFKDLIDPNAERRRTLMLRKMREMDVERDSTQTISPNETP